MIIGPTTSSLNMNQVSNNHLNIHQSLKENISETTKSSNRLELKVFWKDKDDFSHFRKDMENLFHDVYEGLNAEQFTSRMGSIADRYVTKDMGKEEKESVVRSIGVFSKLINQIVTNQRMAHDPELKEKMTKLHQEDMDMIRQLRESGSNATITRSNPYKNWVNPKILNQYKTSVNMINQWATQYASKNNLDPVAVSTPDMDFRDIIKNDNEGLVIDVKR